MTGGCGFAELEARLVSLGGRHPEGLVDAIRACVRLELPVPRCKHRDGGCRAPVRRIALIDVSLPMFRCGDFI